MRTFLFWRYVLRHHWFYLKYLIKHKWYVGIACFKMGLYWQGIVHDWSKFLPCEWLPYSIHFYTSKNNDNEYAIAWLHHIHKNPHHWEYWIIPRRGESIASDNVFKPNGDVLEMPEKYAIELLCDWWGAGKAQGHGKSVQEWYEVNQYNIILHPNTRRYINNKLNNIKWLSV